jgi:hypothetical protein
MKTFKPSELPSGTVIDDPKEGTWMKDTDRAWTCLMPNRTEWIFDDGCTHDERVIFAHTSVRFDAADETFKDFKVLAFPIEMFEELAQWYSASEGDPVDYLMTLLIDGYKSREAKAGNKQEALVELHKMARHPDYEYATTEGQRKSWNDSDTPPLGEGWERNVDMGRKGWDRFDYTEESYWRRKKV